MDTSKHTVTLPIEDYNELNTRMNNAESYRTMVDGVLNGIEKVLQEPKMDRLERFDKIRNIMNHWNPYHPYSEEDFDLD